MFVFSLPTSICSTHNRSVFSNVRIAATVMALAAVEFIVGGMLVPDDGLCVEPANSGVKRPNIVYILCDDLGSGDVKAFNPNSKIPTPNIDQLASQGMRFTDSHSGSAVCTPTRYGIVCGRYAWRTRLQNGVLGGLSPSLISANQITVPKLLKSHGYHSACIGKWHLGIDWKRPAGKQVSENSIETADQNRNVDYDQPFGGGPMRAGFDEYFGISASLDMVPYVYLKDRSVTESPKVDKSFGMRFATDKSQTRVGPGAEGFTAEDVLPRLTREAIAYLERRSSAADQHPFFLYLPFASPHTPIAPTQHWEGKSGLNPYADFVMQQDESVGQILQALARLKLDQNTVVFFTSDNGCSPQADLPALREKGHDPCYPYRGHKADIFEGGHRIPMVVRWPGVIKPNSVANQTVCLTDLMATAADIAGIPLPAEAAPDSFSWLPLFKNDQADEIRPATVHHSINGSFAIRKGAYKLCFCPDSGGWSEPKPNRTTDADAHLQLFDLSKDLKETNNIASDHPELVTEMAKLMEETIARGRSTPGPRLTNDVPVNLWSRVSRPKSLPPADLSNRFQSPKPYQVFQRKYNVPQLSHAHNGGRPARGFADVPVVAQVPAGCVVEARWLAAVPESNQSHVSWTKLAMANETGDVRASLSVPAGGWYRLQLRCTQDNRLVASGDSGPFGVGELFIVAGQSYATNCNDERQSVQDALQRVAALDVAHKRWSVAHDPQPVFDNSNSGSIWPIVGDALTSILQVPVGFANVAVGGTSSTQWAPEGTLHPRLIEAGNTLGEFRAVLWQQGESDVIEKTTTETYVQRLLKIREAAEKQWNKRSDWILAKSTLHPTVYNEPLAEHRIRSAIDLLIDRHQFVRGPDTDLLADVNRGPSDSRRHFSAIGQKNAAAMWFATLLNHLQQPQSLHEAAIETIDQMYLLEPAWQSETVFRESSVLLQLDKNGTRMARLAFPASQILSVVSANSEIEFQAGRDFILQEDKQTLNWLADTPEAITSAQLFPSKDAPNSYRHRAGNPDQNLLYSPGRWFHDHNIEITYRRANFQSTVQSSDGLSGLGRCREKLKSKASVKIAVSGDSISTGLDASGTTQSAPNQPGYPELVAAQLTRSFGCKVELTNRAVSGWSIAQGVADLDNLLSASPDLLIVAYGMNDVGRRDPAWFSDQARTIRDRAKARLPELEILWVSPMLGNKEWVHTPREMFARYRDELARLVGPGTALADLTSVWETMLIHKHDLDLTGNGLNHPNDFGHRLYAQAILQKLVR